MVILRGDPIDLWPMVALPEQPSGRCEHIRFDATGNLPAIDVTTDVRKKSSQRSLVILVQSKRTVGSLYFTEILEKYGNISYKYHLSTFEILFLAIIP